jgi:hypothetical protein
MPLFREQGDRVDQDFALLRFAGASFESRPRAIPYGGQDGSDKATTWPSGRAQGRLSDLPAD